MLVFRSNCLLHFLFYVGLICLVFIAKMPVLQPNVNIIGTRTKSGRIHKPARNFSSDEYVVPTLVKRRIPNNSRANAGRTTPSEPAPIASTSVSEIDAVIN